MTGVVTMAATAAAAAVVMLFQSIHGARCFVCRWSVQLQQNID